MKCYVIATKPYPEKIVDDKLYFDKAEAESHCEELNDKYGANTFKVFPASILIEDKECVREFPIADGSKEVWEIR